ncbi:LysR family transcriptional regulator [Vibrio nitrifigilis]|uniref:LysR family transcriptional regulator n=1 Tax=Vibrio nitrifigilis TaxID=2789781 RepID=A0ABS0GF13_9VIBR|nr:LysR family transcriptional regulator [Vibrio nitrifigilis]MBF9000999.1 LysR family transcriptional regulator [Vibrio nitrifigilis]
MERIDCDRMFVAVMELGSFTKAAERMGTSSGQASKLISRLEQVLGVQLLKRSTRSLVATDVGRGYYEGIKAILDDFDALDDSIRNAAHDPAGRVRISVPVTFGETLLTPVLMEFAKQFPRIQLDVKYEDRAVNIVDEGYDLALRIGHLNDSSLIARKLCDIHVWTVASPAYLAEFGTPTHWHELNDHQLVIDSNFRDPNHWTFRNAEGKVEYWPVAGRLRFSNASACQLAAKQGLGITKLPSFVAQDDIANGDLISVLSEYEIPALGLYALYPPSKHLARSSRAFIDFLVEKFRS